MATMATAAIRERFDRRAAGEDLRPGLPEPGATWRADRLDRLPEAGRPDPAVRGRGARGTWGASGAEGIGGAEGATPFWMAVPGARPSGASGRLLDTGEGLPSACAPLSGMGSPPSAASVGPEARELASGAPLWPWPPLWRGLGANRPRGLAWPPRSFAGGDTIRLPVTFAVSRLGPFP
jgi:hypothetical protein